MKKGGYLTSLVLLVLLSGGSVYAQTSAQNTIVVERPWARATPAGAKTGVVYVTLINNGSAGSRPGRRRARPWTLNDNRILTGCLRIRLAA